MNRLRQQKSWIVLVAILLLLGACKGESPTAPPPGGNPNPPGGATPPSGVSLSLTTSNADPLVDSTVVITATVQDNGQAVPNGTAVEFTSTGGSLDSGGRSIIKTTTNGVATVTLSSNAAAAVRVTATVNNVTRNIDVTFRARPVTPPPVSTTPTISAVTPAIGRPQGGETIRITGTNFKTPVRVLFNTGGATPVEAFVVSVTDTVIEAITPAVNLGAGQQLESDIIVLTQAGTTSEQRVEAAAAFTYRNDRLTPIVSTASPNSGPVTGGTRVTIFGEGFQAPVQVLFGSAEARVISVDYAQIIVESPAGRDTSPNGSGTVTGPVDIIVRNINSNTSVTASSAFRYVAAMQITAVGPNEGPFTGGTRVSIDGIGFLAPVAVSIGGVAAQPISVSGTRIIALTPSVALTGCGDVSGPVTVTNIVNGDTATGPSFTYRVPPITIIAVTPNTVTEGNSTIIRVANALPGTTRLKLGDRTVFPTNVTTNTDGTVDYTVAVPTSFTFPEEACTEGGVEGTRQGELVLSVTYLNVESGCTDTADDALTVLPTDTSCNTPPPAEAVVTPFPSCADMGNVASAGTTTGTTTITVTNTGGQPLIVSSATIVSPSNTTTATVAPASATIAPQASQTFTVTADPAAPGAFGGTVRLNTNDTDEATIDACFSGNGT